MAEFRRAATDLRDTLDAEVARTEAPAPKRPALIDRGDEQGQATATDAKTHDERP